MMLIKKYGFVLQFSLKYMTDPFKETIAGITERKKT